MVGLHLSRVLYLTQLALLYELSPYFTFLAFFYTINEKNLFINLSKDMKEVT